MLARRPDLLRKRCDRRDKLLQETASRISIHAQSPQRLPVTQRKT